MKKKNIFILLLFFGLLFFWQPSRARAMPVGTLLYRTSSDGLAYGYNKSELIIASKGIVKGIYSGHVGIYVGKINNEDYVAEALASGLQLTPAKYFINTRNKEQLIGAKIPKKLSEAERQRVVELAKVLAESRLGYDYDFQKQKGPDDGDWTCVGFTEKIYENADIKNPHNPKALTYDPNQYAIDITPDGYDAISIYNPKTGDCFATTVEFSKIAKKTESLIPAPEIIGYDAGLEIAGNRYFFIPYTQFVQPTLEDVEVDIPLASDFDDESIRGKTPTVSLLLRWSLVNNPLSTVKQLAYRVGEFFGINPDVPEGILTLSPVAANTEISDEKNNKSDSQVSAAKKSTKGTKSTKNVATTKITTVKNSAVNQKTTVSSSSNEKVVSSISSKSVNSENVNLKKATIPSRPVTSNNQNNEDDQRSVVNNYQTIVNQNQEDLKHQIIIAAFGHDGTGHWLKLYNPNNETVDLESETYRLEKSKTAVDPGIMIRFGNTSDASYPGGTEIPAHSTYLLVDDGVGETWRQVANVLVSNSNFSWGDSGYTLYLGTGAISSEEDNDIRDMVGFGPDSSYYEVNPAPALDNNHYLSRRPLANTQPGVDSDNNGNDFLLLSSGNEEESEEENNEEENNTEDEEGDNNEEDDTEENGEGENDNATSTDQTDGNQAEAPPRILIARIFATGDDDAIELYNPNDQPVDLSVYGYRLEKTKTAADPSILIRIGDSGDGAYPGGTIIGPRQTYLIVRDDASAVFRSRAQAIASDSGFTWSEDGYALFLGTDAISGEEDDDLVDLVGFGPSAVFYRSSPAPAITDGYILTRKASSLSTPESMINSIDGYGYDSGDNSQDFVLVGNGNSEDDSIDNLSFNQSQDSSGIIHLWHFDECYGSNFTDSVGNNDLKGSWKFAKGLFGCGLYSPVPGPEVGTVFSSRLDISQMTLGFWQKNTELGRIKFRFFNQTDPVNDVSITLSPFYTEITGLPAARRFYGNALPNDNSWHQIFLVIDKNQDGWRLYIDGQFVREGFFDVIFTGDYDTFAFGDGNGRPLIDEVALWGRPLSSSEIAAAYSQLLPFSPIEKRVAPVTPEVVADWSFDERQGIVAMDALGQNSINLSESLWTRSGYRDGGLRWNSGSQESIFSDLDSTISSADVAFDFWLQKLDGASSGHGQWSLLSGSERIFGLSSGTDYTAYQWEGNEYRLNNNLLALVPNDNNWHHIALAYDSYNYQLNYAVDGELLYSVDLPWLNYNLIDGLDISGSGIIIDDFRIWRGAFAAAGLSDLYQGSKID